MERMNKTKIVIFSIIFILFFAAGNVANFLAGDYAGMARWSIFMLPLFGIGAFFVYRAYTGKGEELRERYIEKRNMEKLPAITGSITDVKGSTLTYVKENYLWQAISLIAGEFLILYLLARFAILSEFFVIVLILIPVWAYRDIKNKVYAVFMRQFARANDFKFSRDGKFNKSANGSIFKRGHSKKIYNVVEGAFLNCPLRIFNYEYTSGRGRSKQTYKNTIFSLTFKKKMPHLYLDNTSNNRSFYTDGFETIDLESNRFNDEFRLFMKKGEHIPALQIFTPDVMAKIIDLPGRADVEFVGKNIYIYEDHLIGTKKELEETFELAKYLVHNMDHVLKSMNYRDPDEKEWDIIGSI